MTTTISVFTARPGSFPGRSRLHPRLLEEAAKRLRAREGDLLADSFVARCGNELGLVMTHARGAGNQEVRALACETLLACARLGREMRLSGASSDAANGIDPGVAELEVEERDAEPVLVVMADGAGPGAWNLPLYRAFADPFTAPGLVLEPSLRRGFVFEVHDLVDHRRAVFETPGEAYDLLACIGAPSRFAITRVFSRDGAIAASTSARRAGSAVMLARAESGFPAVGEVLNAFATPVAAGMDGPLLPVGVCDANGSTTGSSCAICLGFQVAAGRLIGPADLFDDPVFDPVRRRCLELAGALRAQGPFELHRPARPGPVPPGAWEPLG